MAENSLHALLDHATAEEPPLGPLVVRALSAGRRLRRRRRVQAAAGSALAVAVVAAVPAAHGLLSRPHQPANPAAGTPMMYVATTADTVVPVDVRTDKAFAPIKLPKTMVVCMAVTRNGKTIYVAGFDGDITPVSTATRTAGRPIHFDGHPGQIVLEPDGRSGFVVGDGGGLTPVNFVTGTTGRPIKQRAIQHVIMSPDGRTAYGLNGGPTRTVIPIDLAADRALAPVTFPRLVLQFTITPSGKSAWVFLGGTAKTGELVKVNLTTWATSAPIKLPDGVQQVAFGPRDATAYAFGGDEVTPIDLARRTLGTPIKVPVPARAWPAGFSLSPDGRTAIVYNIAPSREAEIVSVNLAHGTALRPEYLGYQRWWPIHVTFAPDSRTAYVSIVTDASGGRLGKLIPVSAATGKRTGRPINTGGQPLQILVTR
jgi:DNA-binding beta-propeller fold protein YncE